jgi:hypothetical protein
VVWGISLAERGLTSEHGRRVRAVNVIGSGAWAEFKTAATHNKKQT